MRFFITGLLCLLVSSAAFAQARGEVQSIGIGGHFRPGSWTPMLVKLVPTTGTQFRGRIEVVQEDLDRDQVIFMRQVVLDANPENGSPPDLRFWMYFMPEPSKDQGDLDQTLSLAKLSERIRVRLSSESGKELVKLPITQQIQPMESPRAGNGSDPRGRRSVLIVHENHYPNFREYQMMTGLTEDLWVVSTREIASGLPDNVIGYDAIDTILWCDADPIKLSTEQLTALEDFVKRGGKFVISQDTATNQWQRNGVKFPLMMPVNVPRVEERDDHAATIRLLAGVRFTPSDKLPSEAEKDWDRLKGPFRYATAEVKPGATVVSWQTTEPDGEPLMDATGKPKPYIVRQGFGAGSVTWIAQDLGDKQLLGTGASYEEGAAPREYFSTRGWYHVWDKVFDWPNETVPQRNSTANFDPVSAPFAGGTTWELGRSFLEYMDLPSRSAALIGIAVLFFLVYWVGAGPGSYFVLSRKGKSALSWFTFAAIAIGATALTAGIVRLVLRGSPELQHVTLVRVVPGEPAWVQSSFGLDIPRDGKQKIELKDAAAGRSSYIRPFNLHPAFNIENAEFPARQEYDVPVKELHEQDHEAADPKSIEVPYRSTLKKFEVEWIGNPTGLSGGIDGKVTLAGTIPWVRGDLTNNTGHDLRTLYLVVHNPALDLGGVIVGQDVVLYVSFWPKGSSISLTKEFSSKENGGAPQLGTKDLPMTDPSNPNAILYIQGRIKPDKRGFADNWADYWYSQQGWRRSGGFMGENREYSEKDPLTPASFPVLSFFDRIPVSRNEIDRQNKSSDDRINFLRRGVREYDMSASVSGGNMAIIGVSTSREEELPFPLEVQGDRIKGKGIIYYQFVVSVDRSAVTKAPTPATRPAATQPKGKAEG